MPNAAGAEWPGLHQGALLRRDRLIGTADLSHLDGPWEPSQNFRKVNGFARYVSGTPNDGYSATGMYYQANGNLTTDQPLRAIKEGLISANGTLDPTDGSQSQRWSLDGHYARSGDGWSVKANAFYIHSKMILWNDFTHFLSDPILDDQEQQTENRDVFGGGASLSRETQIAGIESEWTLGVQERYDTEFIDRGHTYRSTTLSYCNDGADNYNVGLYACAADRVSINDVAPYVENSTNWLSWLRTTIGFREDYQSAGATPLVAKIHTAEIGFRTKPIEGLNIQFAAFREDASSELEYDADAGQDSATAPSRRQGFELSAQYHPPALAGAEYRYSRQLSPLFQERRHIGQ